MVFLNPKSKHAGTKTMPEKRGAVEDQCRIGRAPFLVGRILVHWRRIQEKHYNAMSLICQASAGYAH